MMVSIFRKNKATSNNNLPSNSRRDPPKPPAVTIQKKAFLVADQERSPPAIDDHDFHPATFAVTANNGDAPCSTVTSFEDEDDNNQQRARSGHADQFSDHTDQSIDQNNVNRQRESETNSLHEETPEQETTNKQRVSPAPLMTEISNKARMRRLVSGVVDKEYIMCPGYHSSVHNNRRASEAPRQVTEGPTAKAFHKMTSTVACPGFQDEGAATELRQALQLRKLKTKQYDN